MKGSRRYTISYSCVQASFWMSLCVFSGFCAVYLQSLGYSNAELGIVLACGTLLGSLLGPAVSSLIDRSAEDRITASGMMPPVIAAESLAAIVMLLFPVRDLVTSASFVLFVALAITINSLILKLYTDADYCEMNIDYGVSRSMGSLGYVLTSFLVGLLCENISPRVVPAAGLAVCVFQFASYLRFNGYLREFQAGSRQEMSRLDTHAETPGTAGFADWSTPAERRTDSDRKTGTTVATFLLRNKSFCLILAGSVLVFFAHNTLCNFFINVVRNVGGNTGDMGFLNGLMALIEIPVIFFYTQLSRRWKTSSVLRTGFIFFTAKAAAIAMAGSVAGIAGALLLQAPSFGLYTGAIVPYVDETISYEDSAKAQSLAFSVTMLGSVFASTISGHLFDVMSVSSVMWVSCAVSAIGSVLACLGAKNTMKGVGK